MKSKCSSLIKGYVEEKSIEELKQQYLVHYIHNNRNRKIENNRKLIILYLKVKELSNLHNVLKIWNSFNKMKLL